MFHCVIALFVDPTAVLYDGLANEFNERARAGGQNVEYVAYMRIYAPI
jgi:hypothetical protein